LNHKVLIFSIYYLDFCEAIELFMLYSMSNLVTAFFTFNLLTNDFVVRFLICLCYRRRT